MLLFYDLPPTPDDGVFRELALGQVDAVFIIRAPKT
jgi:hypothetical protein